MNQALGGAEAEVKPNVSGITPNASAVNTAQSSGPGTFPASHL
jgi:hypothetical protein